MTSWKFALALVGIGMVGAGIAAVTGGSSSGGLPSNAFFFTLEELKRKPKVPAFDCYHFVTLRPGVAGLVDAWRSWVKEVASRNPRVGFFCVEEKAPALGEDNWHVAVVDKPGWEGGSIQWQASGSGVLRDKMDAALGSC